VREAKDFLIQEAGKLTEQVKEAGRTVEQQASQQLEPVRDLRRQAGSRLDSAAALVKEKTVQFETQVANELKPAMQLRDQTRRGVEDAGAKAASATKTYADAVKNNISKAGRVVHVPIKAETDRLQFVDPVKAIEEKAALLIKNNVKLATTTNPAEIKNVINDLQHTFVDPTVDTLRIATKEMGDATRPLTKPIEDKVAPVLKKGLEHVARGTTASTEGAIKAAGAIAGAAGDKTTQKKLNEASDKVSKKSHKTAKDVAEASGKIVTAKNATRVAATVIGTAYGGPMGGAAALSVVQAAQGDTVTGKDIAINVVAGYASAGVSCGVDGMGSGGVGSAIAAGAAAGATRNVVGHSLHAAGDNKPITFTDLRDQALAGAAAGATGAGMGVTLGSDAGIGGEAIKSGTTAATENAVRQYQTTGEVDLQKVAEAFGAGAMNAGFSSAVEAIIPEEMKPQLKTTTPQADENDSPEVSLLAQKAENPRAPQFSEPRKSPLPWVEKKDWSGFRSAELGQNPVPQERYNPNDKAQQAAAQIKPIEKCEDLDLMSKVIWPDLPALPPARQSSIPYKEGYFPEESSKLYTAAQQKSVTNPNPDPAWLSSDKKQRPQPNPFPQGREDKDDFIIKRGIPYKSNATQAQRALNSIGEGAPASGNKKSDSLKSKQSYKQAVNRNRSADIVRPTEPNPHGFWQKTPLVGGGIIDLINIFVAIEQNTEQSREEITKKAILGKFGGCDGAVLHPDDHYVCGQEKYQKLQSEWQTRISEVQQLTGEDYSGDINKILWRMSAEKRKEFEAKTDAYIESLKSKKSSEDILPTPCR